VWFGFGSLVFGLCFVKFVVLDNYDFMIVLFFNVLWVCIRWLYLPFPEFGFPGCEWV